MKCRKTHRAQCVSFMTIDVAQSADDTRTTQSVYSYTYTTYKLQLYILMLL